VAEGICGFIQGEYFICSSIPQYGCFSFNFISRFLIISPVLFTLFFGARDAFGEAGHPVFFELVCPLVPSLGAYPKVPANQRSD
jgi:hypothetical protein